MSAWLHVSAICRIDGFYEGSVDWDEVFGKECLWDADESTWDDAKKNKNAYMPMGSEGSLRRIVWTNPHTNHADRYTISIFGDLRNVAYGQWVIDWFKEKLKHLRVRQAVITTEGYDGIKTWTWTYNDN